MQKYGQGSFRESCNGMGDERASGGVPGGGGRINLNRDLLAVRHAAGRAINSTCGGRVLAP